MPKTKKTKKTKKLSDDLVLDAMNKLDDAKHAYLRSHGWRNTSSTPGCLWMWVKRCKIDTSATCDIVLEPCWIMVNTDTAISMQRHSCAIRGNAW